MGPIMGGGPLSPDAARSVLVLGSVYRPYPDRNGGAKAIPKDIDSLETTRETMALLKMLALGNRQIDAGRVQPAADVIALLRKR